MWGCGGIGGSFIWDNYIFVWLKTGDVQAKIGLTGQLEPCLRIQKWIICTKKIIRSFFCLNLLSLGAKYKYFIFWNWRNLIFLCFMMVHRQTEKQRKIKHNYYCAPNSAVTLCLLYISVRVMDLKQFSAIHHCQQRWLTSCMI